MKIGERHYRSIWAEQDRIFYIDQTRLPHELRILELTGWEDAANAIRTMEVRGAPLIGVTAAWGLALASRKDPTDDHLRHVAEALMSTRPTAVNLRWAVDRMLRAVLSEPEQSRSETASRLARELCDEDVRINESIGKHGAEILRELASGLDRPLNVLTHCNAGWLATVDHGTALSPIFRAHDDGVPIHVWVDETRPRNQGAGLTAWELASHGVPHHVIVDNAGGHLMQTGQVDLCITGTDRVARNGDVCNKIGTYLKALAAHDNHIPFYVALPSPTIDLEVASGREIPIEERSPDEVTRIAGLDESGVVRTVQLTPDSSPARNYGFDVTPARLVTALITERGVVPASEESLAAFREE